MEYHTKDVIVAHHGDDQLETLLMRLYRGSGISGLACMRSIQVMDDSTRRIRPLLSLSKARLLATCKTRSIPYVIDPSNNDLQYDRNRVRHGIQLLRESSSSSSSIDLSQLFPTIHFFQYIRDGMEEETMQALRVTCECNEQLGICRINTTSLSTYSEMVVANVLRMVCSAVGGVKTPSEKAIQRITGIICGKGRVEKPMQVAGCVVCISFELIRYRSIGWRL